MALKYGKKELTQIADVLQQDHETVEDAAKAVLQAAEGIFEQRAKFAVAGQLYYSGGYVNGDDARQSRVILGWHSTLGDAQKAADSLFTSNTTHEQFLTWVVPVFHGTASDFYKSRKKKREQVEAEENDRIWTQRMKDWEQQIERRAREVEITTLEL